MSSTPRKRGSRAISGLSLPVSIGLSVAMVSVIGIASFSYANLERRDASVNAMAKGYEALAQLERVMALAKEAESASRGYLVSGDARHVDTFNVVKAALPAQLQLLSSTWADRPEQKSRLTQLEGVITLAMASMQRAIELEQQGKHDAARALVQSGEGRTTMSSVRETGEALRRQEENLLALSNERWRDISARGTFFTLVGAGVLLVLVFIAAFLMSRDARLRSLDAWIGAAQSELATRVQGELSFESLGQKVTDFLAQYLEAQVAALYVSDGEHLTRVGTFGLRTENGAVPEKLKMSEGLTGQAVRAGRAIVVRDLPANYTPVASGTGSAAPRELALLPARHGGLVQAVVELGFFRPVQEVDLQLLERIAEVIARAVRSVKDAQRLQHLLEETQHQAMELQSQQEELRVSNEELEERSRILKESQVRQQASQAELEQINAQLELQTRQLEAQRTELLEVQGALATRAAQLQRANTHKNEFLANMSHELRTPLNSSLILAQLLSENRDGNLSAEQVKYAQTILGAGKDLLALINDILDLSKIEAGRVELLPEPTQPLRMAESLERTFAPVAKSKNLSFGVELLPALPATIETDAQRALQVLKNLLSNAFKFTESGGVTLRIAPTRDESAQLNGVRFDVTDTGIGIAADQTEIIFEAFRQADGSIHRKYGGTGLGLSISRDLARLLGGDLTVTSTPGQGSTFSFTLPLQAPPARVEAATSTASLERPRPKVGPLPVLEVPQVGTLSDRPRATTTRLPMLLPPATPGVRDDREVLKPEARHVLVVDDDVSFGAILFGLAHEAGFQCLVATTADEGLQLATQTEPSAILLDLELPDHPGLGLLDQLKRNPRTRHIPVHIISVDDQQHAALSMGAVGYALKPVAREQLVETFQRLQRRLAQSLRRVLVIEDDQEQRESVRKLLSSDGVEVVTVATAHEGLEKLQSTTFDCLVMDLTPADSTGFELLEHLASSDAHAFPPVIVYTARQLTADEETRLRRYSRSIIVKGAHSPERLLDEVTLFLHQVESRLPADRQRMLKQARDRESAFEGRQVLVVEDDVRNVFALTALLEPKGAKVEIARNGKEALVLLDKKPPGSPGGIDLVLMDVMMPEMDGLTCTRELRKRPDCKKLPVIALTAKAMRDDQEQCLSAGANDYIAKPFDTDKLLSLIRVWMRP